uniref:Uncharacterized protein n=1 Tax=Amorphochlora amoebiformis TaxID=1561963 RepID=A0A0H5BLK3_9EUKA|nr:hypothetical protein [Amorphochlora amoebiformis]
MYMILFLEEHYSGIFIVRFQKKSKNKYSLKILFYYPFLSLNKIMEHLFSSFNNSTYNHLYHLFILLNTNVFLYKKRKKNLRLYHCDKNKTPLLNVLFGINITVNQKSIKLRKIFYKFMKINCLFMKNIEQKVALINLSFIINSFKNYSTYKSSFPNHIIFNNIIKSYSIFLGNLISSILYMIKTKFSLRGCINIKYLLNIVKHLLFIKKLPKLTSVFFSFSTGDISYKKNYLKNTLLKLLYSDKRTYKIDSLASLKALFKVSIFARNTLFKLKIFKISRLQRSYSNFEKFRKIIINGLHFLNNGTKKIGFSLFDSYKYMYCINKIYQSNLKNKKIFFKLFKRKFKKNLYSNLKLFYNRHIMTRLFHLSTLENIIEKYYSLLLYLIYA